MARSTRGLLVQRRPQGLKARHYVFFAGIVCILFGIVVLAFSWSIALILFGLGGILVSVASLMMPNGMRQ